MKQLSRRAMLRGAAAAAIGLPFLESVAPRRTASADPAAIPKRFVMFNRPWGTIPTKWSPLPGFGLNEIMQPLQTMKDRGKLTVVSGISMETAEAQFGGRGSHPQGELHALTARRSDEIVYRCIKWVDGQSVEVPIGNYTECDDGNLDIFGKPGGPSIDTLIADEIWGGSKIKMLAVGRNGTGLSVDKSKLLVPLITDLKTLFHALFADANTSVDELERLRIRRASILDAVGADFGRFRDKLSQRDRERVESHFTSIREIEQSLEGPVRVCEVPVGEPGEDHFDGPQIFERIKTANSMIAMALACDVTRVASLYWHPDGTSPADFDGLGLTEPGAVHADPHGEGSHAFPDQVDRIRNATGLHRIWMSFLADLAEKMDAPEMAESDGATVLDHTILLHSSDMVTGLHTFKAGVGAWNNRQNGEYARGMPYLYLGGSRCGLKTNVHHELDGPSQDQSNFAHGEFLMTLARALGVSEAALPAFGEPEFCQKLVSPILA